MVGRNNDTHSIRNACTIAQHNLAFQAVSMFKLYVANVQNLAYVLGIALYRLTGERLGDSFHFWIDVPT